MQAFQDYFTGIGTARLSRSRFAILFFSLITVAFALVLLFGASIGVAERFSPGFVEILKSQIEVIRTAGIIGILAFALCTAAFIWAQINLVAKRARDIGWNPILITAIYLILVSATGLGLLFAMGLALVPRRSST
jgi:uncharacterized membrane protein YhaH (DUF805 family)